MGVSSTPVFRDVRDEIFEAYRRVINDVEACFEVEMLSLFFSRDRYLQKGFGGAVCKVDADLNSTKVTLGKLTIREQTKFGRGHGVADWVDGSMGQ